MKQKINSTGLRAIISRNRILLLLLFVFIILRIPSLLEPHWYLDEGMYATIGDHIASGKTLYGDIYDHKPQLIFYLYSLFSVLGNSLFVAKLTNIIAGAVTITLIYALARRRLGFAKNTALLSSGIAVLLLGTPVFEGNIANAENFFLPLSVAGIYLGLGPRYRHLFLSGLMFGIALHIKLHPLLDLAALAVFILTVSAGSKTSLRKTFKKLLAVVCGFLLPIIFFSLLEAARGTFGLYIEAAYLDAYAYSGQTTAYIQRTELKLLIVAAGVIAASYAYYKGKIGKQLLLILLLLLFAGFASVLSGRVFYHYLLQLVPALSLAGGYLYQNHFKHSQQLTKAVTASLVITAVIVFAAYFNSSYELGYKHEHRSLPDNWFAVEYYYNFARHALTGRLESDSYKLFFSDRPLKLEDLDALIESDARSVYIYSDLGWAYTYTDTLSPTRIFVAFQLDYRDDSRDKDATIAELTANLPQVIIIDSTKTRFDRLDDLLSDSYSLAGREGDFLMYKLSTIDN